MAYRLPPALGRLARGGENSGAWSPFHIPRPTAWWRFKDAIHDLATNAPATIGQTITRVPDRSGNGHHLTQTNVNRMPTLEYFSEAGISEGVCGRFADLPQRGSMTAALDVMNTVKTVYMMAYINSGFVQMMPFRIFNNSGIWINHFASYFKWGDFEAMGIRPTGDNSLTVVPNSAVWTEAGYWCVNEAQPIAIVYGVDKTKLRVYFDSDTPIPVKSSQNISITPIDEISTIDIGGHLGGFIGSIREMMVYDGAHNHETVLKIRNYLRNSK